LIKSRRLTRAQSTPANRLADALSGAIPGLPVVTMACLEGRPRAPRLPALTGIRIFAALAVYGSHVGVPAGSPDMLGSFLTSGYCGVTIFFVLSGFVLAINYFDGFRHPTVRGTYSYFVARFARVYPLYILVLFFLIVRQHTLGLGSVDGWWRSALALQAWDPNLDHAYAFDPPAWSISVEFFLYACFAVLLAAAGVTALMAGLAAWFVFSGRGDLIWTDPGSAHRWLYRTPLTRLGDFALGILAARLYIQTRSKQSIGRLGLPLVLGGGAMLIGFMCWEDLVFTPWSWDLAYGVPAAIFIFGLAVAPLSWPSRFFALPFIVLLGEASYAFYLVHQPAIGFLGAGTWTAGMSFSKLLYEALALGAIIALAVGLHITIERPARTYIRRALAWRKARAKAPPPPPPRTRDDGELLGAASERA
jgi:peptidoglycan/LPS O-acetylase OafA/YrhL